VMLFEMLTHEPLFTGSQKEIIARVLFMEIPSPRSGRNQVAEDLEAITKKLLARGPGDRYPNAEAVIEDLLRCDDAPRDGRGELVHVLAQRFPETAMRTRRGGAGAAIAGRPVHVDKLTVRITDTAPLSTLAGAASQSSPYVRSRRHRALVIGATSGVLIAGVEGILALARRHVPQPQERQQVATTTDAGAPRHAVSTPLPATLISDAATSAHIAIDASVDASADASVADSSPPQLPKAAGIILDAGAPRPAAARGRLTVHADPFADVWIDGRFVNTTPIENLTLAVGSHRVRLVNEAGHHDETIVVTVDPAKPLLIEKNW